ncbi:MAG: type II toxin-antitoxin system RelE/ParE family toxin [Planctomycetes bacterium]|nr:type II toxin-antitoxin system RelE/ParE family toxin [Planctomycetota bacterium]
MELSARAQRDIDEMHRWIAERSPSGANRWYTQFLKLLRSLKANPDAFSVAAETEDFRVPLREALFKTRRGNVYRVLFLIEGDLVRIVTVRGPGQAPVTSDEFDI